MQLSNIPSRILTAFASSAQALKRVIPLPAQSAIVRGRASFSDGFPPECGSLTNGVPPSIYDYNGILNAVTAIQQYQSGGGMFTFDSTWSQANGGYPKGALLISTSGDKFWTSLVDNNASDPDVSPGTTWGVLYPNNGRMLLTGLATPTGAYHDITGIPSWAKRITININALSTNGSAYVMFQAGCAATGMKLDTGYAAAGGFLNNAQTNNVANGNTGVPLSNNNSAADVRYGQMVFTLVSGNTWVATGLTGLTNAASIGVGGGGFTLNGALDRIRITTSNGTDVFNNGNLSLLIEG